MNRRSALWLVPALIYLVFVSWYTDWGGALSPDEIRVFSTKLREIPLEDEQIQRLQVFMETDSGRQFFMLNAIDMSEAPPDVKGAQAGESAEQLMARYMEHMYPELFKRASHPAVLGDAVFRALDLVGVEEIEGVEHWDMGALFRYRSRRSFMEVVSIPETHGRHEFKIAALDKTIAYPLETDFNLGDPRLVLGLILLSATAMTDIAIYGRSRS